MGTPTNTHEKTFLSIVRAPILMYDHAMKNSVALIIPTYNERENIISLCRQIAVFISSASIVIVDDTSADGTADLVEEYARANVHILLVKRKGMRNFAQSYTTGFRKAFNMGVDVIIQMDADLSHAPADIPRLIAALETADCAVGSRYCTGGKTEGWPWHRKAISWLGNIYVAKKTGLPLHDATAGFVAWRASILAQVLQQPSTVNSYAFQIELKYRAWKQGARMIEVPIVFREREKGASKMNWHTIVEAVRFVRSLSH